MSVIPGFPAPSGPIPGAMVEPHVRGLFERDIAVTLCDPRVPLGGLLCPEGNGLGRMVDRRQREFTAGRLAAHRAMAALGHPAQPVLPGPDRAPIWPAGLVGSLSHCDSLCVCAMGHARDLRALGVDVEEDEALDDDTTSLICTAPEAAWLDRQAEPQRGRLARLLFSAKETSYKAQYPLTREVLDFTCVAVLPDLEVGSFSATFTRSIGPFATGTRLQGRFARAHGLILTGMTLRRTSA